MEGMNIMVQMGTSFGNPIPPDMFYSQKPGKAFSNLNREAINDATYYSYLYRLMDLYMSVFEWKNLPVGCDARMLEWWLMFNGFVGFIYDETLEKAAPDDAPLGYAIMQLLLQGQMNMYQLPKQRSAYSVDSAIPLVQGLNKENSVIIFNSQMRVSPFPTLCMFASRLCNIERSIDVNVAQQKCPKVIKCNEKEKLSYENMINQVADNEMYIWGDSKLDLTKVETLDNTSPYVSSELNVLLHQKWNEALTYLGIENTNTDKKERMVTDEVLSNMGDVEANRFTRLNPRKKAANEINLLLEANGYTGEPVEVDYRAGVYIRTDKEGTIPTEGMSVDEDGGDQTGYESGGQPNGTLAKLRKMIRGR